VNPEWRARYETAVEVAEKAGQVALRSFDRALEVEWKADESPVTAADRETEQFLRTTLHAAFAEDSFLGEEYGDAPGTSGFRWVLDPIDGTRSFVRGIPIWATLVGLEYRGEQIAGVATAPALGHTWRALRGDGAYYDGRRARVSDVADLGRALVFYSSLSWFLAAGRQDTFLELARRSDRVRGFGDFYGFVLVAQGAGELMVEHGVHAWDVTAIRPIVEEAGGRFSTWDGQVRVDRPDVVVSNGKVHDEALRVLAGRAGG
jgi:histidinol-phosphatase